MTPPSEIEAASGLTEDEIQARLLVTVTGEDAAFIRRVVDENKRLRAEVAWLRSRVSPLGLP